MIPRRLVFVAVVAFFCWMAARMAGFYINKYKEF